VFACGVVVVVGGECVDVFLKDFFVALLWKRLIPNKDSIPIQHPHLSLSIFIL
jgi:hypothetical protein